MPKVFFTWVGRADKRIRFEFLDNRVPFGEVRAPSRSATTDASTSSASRLLNIDRFARINVKQPLRRRSLRTAGCLGGTQLRVPAPLREANSAASISRDRRPAAIYLLHRIRGARLEGCDSRCRTPRSRDAGYRGGSTGGRERCPDRASR